MTAAFGFTRRRRATRAPLWRVAWLHAVVAAAAALAATGCREPGPAPADVPPRSLLFISIDTLRADHLGVYGYPRATSPRIDAFARDGLQFESFFTTMPKTGPSMTSFFTGRYPHNHGVTENPAAVPESAVLLAEILPERFRKVAVVGNPTLAPERGYDAGFGEFVLTGGDTEEITDRALAWLERLKNAPFFLWVHYLDPHGPYLPPAGVSERFVGDDWYDERERVALDYQPVPGRNPNYVRGAVPGYQRLGSRDEIDYYVARYDAEILFVDAQIGRLLDRMSDSGLDRETLIVITADHGESLGEHDYYFEHGMLVNEGSIRIPLILHHPGLPARRIRALAQNIDLLPTLLTQLGVAYDGPLDGLDLSPLLEGASDAKGRDWVYASTPYPDEYETFFETVRTRTRKLVRSGRGGLEYYDLSRDPKESQDRIEALPAAARDAMLGLLAELAARPLPAAPPPKLSPELRERLEVLGYTQ